jgi:chemotaxis signal transduction protein
MSRKKQATPAQPDRANGDKLAPGQPAQAPPPSDSRAASPPEGEMLDLQALVAEIAARLVTTGDPSLSRPVPLPPTRLEYEQVIVFRLVDGHYAVDLRNMAEVVQNPQITRVPGLPDWVLGVTNLHGEIISVVDLHRFLSLESPASALGALMLVARAGDQVIGLMVHEVGTILTFPTEHLISPPFQVQPELVSYLRGAVERDEGFVRLLDCERLLLGSQMQQFS